MVNMMKRMRALQARLLQIRLGTGAVVLPKDIKRIHLRFAGQPVLGGHMGARKFWHNELVRLQYHNPAVHMTTDRTAKREDAAVLSVHRAPAGAPQTSHSATSSAAPTDSHADAAPTERVETIDMLHKTNSQILEELVRLTDAFPIEPTPTDLEELEKVESDKIISERGRERMNMIKAQKKREKELLEAARQTS